MSVDHLCADGLHVMRCHSDCNQPCAGDSKQTCGASYRMSVFGPSPLVPALGHGNVQQTCQPWCVTADVNTDQVATSLPALSSVTSLQAEGSFAESRTGATVLEDRAVMLPPLSVEVMT